MASPCSGDPSPAGLPLCPVATPDGETEAQGIQNPDHALPGEGSTSNPGLLAPVPGLGEAECVRYTAVAEPGAQQMTQGPAEPQAPPFLDIYSGDAQQWEAHFRGIGRAYRALGKEDDFAIRVLTEDFTLPFPFAWPPGPDPARGPLFYDPHDRTGFDFLLRGPGAPPPALLRPLHCTAQAALRKRRLEQLALSYAHAAAGPGPGLVLLAPVPAAAGSAVPGPEAACPSGGAPRLG